MARGRIRLTGSGAGRVKSGSTATSTKANSLKGLRVRKVKRQRLKVVDTTAEAAVPAIEETPAQVHEKRVIDADETPEPAKPAVQRASTPRPIADAGPGGMKPARPVRLKSTSKSRFGWS